MADTETSVGTYLDEIFAKYNSQISSLQNRIQLLESRLSALECQAPIPDSSVGVPQGPIANSQQTTNESSSIPFIEHLATNPNAAREGFIVNNNSQVAPLSTDSYDEFFATPQMWQGDIALRQNDDKFNSIFRVKFAQNEGVVEFNQDAFAFLSGQLEGLLLPYVEYEISGVGVPSCISTTEKGIAHFDGNIWWLKKKAKVVIQ